MFEPQFTITPDLLALLTQATELRAWIAQATVDVAWLAHIQRDTVARLAHSSTAIEGNPLTLPEVEALAQGDVIGAPGVACQEVTNYLAAMRWIWGKRPGSEIKETELLRLHRLIIDKTLSADEVGSYKTRSNRIVNHRGVTIYQPPKPEECPGLTRKLLAWINAKVTKKLHPVIVSGIAHHHLVSIHPFMDGNGRISRALAVWLLYVRGFDTQHLFALDEYFEADRHRYYQKIQQARDLDGNLTYWLEYVAKGIVTTLQQTQRRIESLAVSTKAPRLVLTKRQEDVLRYVGNKGRVGSADIEQAFSISRARVGQIVKPLVDAGLLIREGQTRATVYRLS